VKKSLFEYDNYRHFLRDFYLSAKSENKKFSVRYFSRMAGFKSSGVFNQVMSGKRNIAPHSIEKFVRALKLNSEESHFFKNLVLLNQSREAAEKQRFARELLKSRSYRKIHPLNSSQFNYFAKWYFIVIRELVDLKCFREDYSWISKTIDPPITTIEAERAVKELLKLGLLTRNSKGRLVQTNPNISTTDEVSGSSVAHYHKEMSNRAVQSIDNVSREKRELSAITLGMSLETAKKIKEMIQSFRKRVVEVVSQGSKPSAVYQINLQLFPLVEPKTEKDGKSED